MTSGSYGKYIGTMETRMDGKRTIEVSADEEGMYLKEHNTDTGSTKRMFVPRRKMETFLLLTAEATKTSAEMEMDRMNKGGR